MKNKSKYLVAVLSLLMIAAAGTTAVNAAGSCTQIYTCTSGSCTDSESVKDILSGNKDAITQILDKSGCPINIKGNCGNNVNGTNGSNCNNSSSCNNGSNCNNSSSCNNDSNCNNSSNCNNGSNCNSNSSSCNNGSNTTSSTATQETTTPQQPTAAPTDFAPSATEQPTATQQQATENTNGSSVSAYEQQVIELVNQIRTENGLSPLTLNTKLSDVARTKSQDMKDKGYFSHTSPTYGTPFEMMKTFGITYNTAGENIAMGYATPQAVVNAWMNSEGHRENILRASFTQIGVGYVADGNYWTQMFIG